jgi:hypothetical protein
MRLLVFPLVSLLVSLLLSPSGIARAADSPGLIRTSGQALHLRDSRAKFVSADRDKSNQLLADRDASGEWERFIAVDLGAGAIALRTTQGKYVSAPEDRSRPLAADRDAIGPWETFQVQLADSTHLALVAWHGGIVSADRDRGGALVADRTQVGEWERFTVERWSKDLFNGTTLDHGASSIPSVDSRFYATNGSSLCLDVADERKSSGARWILWGCRSYLEGDRPTQVHHQSIIFDEIVRPQKLPDGRTLPIVMNADAIIRPRHAPDLCLTHHGPDKPVTFDTCTEARNQTWRPAVFSQERAKALGGSDPDAAAALTFQQIVQALLGEHVMRYYQLRSADGYCLDVLGGVSVAGKQIGVHECKPFAHNQVFLFPRTY